MHNLGSLQIRPLVHAHEAEDLHLENVESSKLITQSAKVLGNRRVGKKLLLSMVVDSRHFNQGLDVGQVDVLIQRKARW